MTAGGEDSLISTVMKDGEDRNWRGVFVRCAWEADFVAEDVN